MSLVVITNAKRKPSEATGKVFPFISSVHDGEERAVAIASDDERTLMVLSGYGEVLPLPGDLPYWQFPDGTEEA